MDLELCNLQRRMDELLNPHGSGPLVWYQVLLGLNSTL